MSRSNERPSANGESWLITKLVPGGDGFTRLADGRIGFATGAYPGDRIRVIESEAGRGFVRARRWQLEQGSSERVEPPCVYARDCGGCDWMGLERSVQLRHKRLLLEEALVRTARLSEAPEHVAVHYTEPALGYRSRLRLHVAETGQIGLFARGTHHVVEISRCIVSDELVNAALSEIRAIAARVPGLHSVDQIEIRVAETDPEVSLLLVPKRGTKIAPALLSALGERFSVALAGVGGDAPQRYPLPGGVVLQASPGSFTQVNWSVNQLLVQRVLKGAEQRNIRSFIDLYCGAGNFSLPLLKAGLRGLAIEVFAPAIEDARRSAREQGLDASAFRSGDVASELARVAIGEQRFDLVVLDPPRSGAKDAIPHVVTLAAPWLCLVSCDPVTFARDLSTLLQHGYRLHETELFDMFPHTHHFESLAWLSRIGS